MLLRVVVLSWKPVKLLSQQLPPFLLFLDHRSIAQQCWIRLHSSFNIRDLKIEVFRHFPQTANVRKSRDQGLAVRFAVWGSRLYSLRSKRFRLVSEQKRSWKGTFGFDRARNETRTKKMKEWALLLAPFFARSLTLVPHSLLLNRTETLATQAKFVRLDHTTEVSDLPQGFLHPKTSQSHVWEKIRLFRTVLLIDHRILFQKKNVILKTISQLK